MELATARGKDLAGLVLEAVQEKLEAAEEGAMTGRQYEVSADVWVARLREWASRHRPLPFEADDSRESIYEGRGE